MYHYILPCFFIVLDVDVLFIDHLDSYDLLLEDYGISFPSVFAGDVCSYLLMVLVFDEAEIIDVCGCGYVDADMFGVCVQLLL